MDNCGTVPNSGQSNRDGDDLGDACDPTPDPTFDRSLTLGYSAKKDRAIASPESTCRPGTVKVLRKKKRKDPKVGSANAAPSGKWSLEERVGEGKYYATTAPLVVTGGSCAGAESLAIKID